MATIITCDGGCGAQSPDYTVKRGGPHVANGWLRVRAASNVRFREDWDHDDKLFCDTCAKRVREALRPTTPNPQQEGR